MSSRVDGRTVCVREMDSTGIVTEITIEDHGCVTRRKVEGLCAWRQGMCMRGSGETGKNMGQEDIRLLITISMRVSSCRAIVSEEESTRGQMVATMMESGRETR